MHGLQNQTSIFEALLGKWAPGGVMDADIYLALVTIHGTIMVFFVLTAGLSGTFSNLINSVANWRKRYGLWIP